MTKSILAHSDGRVIIPDEPVELPTDAQFEVKLVLPDDTQARQELSIEERLERLARVTGTLPGAVPSDESLRRENLYDERL